MENNYVDYTDEEIKEILRERKRMQREAENARVSNIASVYQPVQKKEVESDKFKSLKKKAIALAVGLGLLATASFVGNMDFRSDIAGEIFNETGVFPTEEQIDDRIEEKDQEVKEKAQKVVNVVRNVVTPAPESVFRQNDDGEFEQLPQKEADLYLNNGGRNK